MTFKDIAIKNFKGSMRNYISYFLCNSFLVMTFFMYSTLIFNEKFTKSSQVEAGVTNAMIIPNVALVAFSIFFVSYSHVAFIKGRKKEFGLLMNLGMSINDIRKIILYENSLIAMSSILLGILSGTIFSRLFFLIITRAMEVKEIAFQVNIKNYIVSIGVFIVIFITSLLSTLIATCRFEIIKLLKADRVWQKNKFNSGILALLGIIIIIVFSVILYVNFGKIPVKDGNLLLQCTIYILIGLYLAISQLGGFLLKLAKKNKKIYYRNTLLLTNINYKFKQTKKIMFIIAIMVMVIIFYSGHVMNTILLAEKTALEVNPYDIAFTQSSKENNISKDKIDNLIANSNNQVTEHKTIEFIKYLGLEKGGMDRIIISSKELNDATFSNFKVDKGKYIEFINSEVKDGKKFVPREEKFKFTNKELKFVKQESVHKKLFNYLNNIGIEFTILNEEDYKLFKDNDEGIDIGRIELYNFKDWKQTKILVEDLEKEFEEYNKTSKVLNHLSSEKDKHYTKMVVSKIGEYNYNRQGGILLVYLLIYIGVIFFVAISVVLFLKLFSDLDNDKLKYKQLYKIGITDEEIKKAISSEMKPIFFIAPIVGISIALAYTLVFYKGSDTFIYAIGCDLVIGSVFLILQLAYYFLCRNFYYKKIVDE